MTGKVRAFLEGVGSLMNLFPGPEQFEKFQLKGSPEERLAEHWRRVGGYLRSAMDGYGDAECEHREPTPAREESRTGR
ncbi:MAG: hypothetical protein F4023_02560 [Acidobacteria bacterium]|nr:hypothetical protein [Acidobacteriota bacterium]MYA44963.1 hypothetical protein [Acidobacteriota bacterium]MYH23171.1 hypothetical protein [Acidobacteriota bacterium]MYI38958.1 hypothetical protein [Acidobacteriota bacterium]MYK78525.1 hypothetical protein [Acidobacteriota bacterium]